MKRPVAVPPPEPRHLSRQKDDFTSEGAPAPEPVDDTPAVQARAAPKPARPAPPRTRGPGIRKGPPQGKYG